MDGPLAVMDLCHQMLSKTPVVYQINVTVKFMAKFAKIYQGLISLRNTTGEGNKFCCYSLHIGHF